MAEGEATHKEREGMRTIRTIREGGKVVGIISGPDACDQSFVVNGRTWRFDFDEYGGPLWLRNSWNIRDRYPL